MINYCTFDSDYTQEKVPKVINQEHDKILPMCFGVRKYLLICHFTECFKNNHK